MEESKIAFTNFLIHIILIHRNLNLEKYLESALVHLFLTGEFCLRWCLTALQRHLKHRYWTNRTVPGHLKIPAFLLSHEAGFR